MMATRDTPSTFSPDVQRLLDQGFPPQQIMAMLQQQNANAPKPFPPAHAQAQNANLNPPLLPNFPVGGPQDPSAQFFNNLDASSSKQLAALTAAGNARRAATTSGGTSGGFVGGMHPNHQTFRPGSSLGQGSLPHIHQAPNSSVAGGLPVSAPFNIPPQNDPSVHHRSSMMSPQQTSQSQSYRARQQSFLHGLAKIMAARNTPLPPSITGVQIPFDTTTSPWKSLEPASEIGGFKLAGRDVDLFKLWGLVFSAGGASKVQQQNGWSTVLANLNLPDRLSQPQENGNISTAVVLAHYYMTLLHPFEEAYVRSVNDAQRRAPQSFPNQQNGMPAGGIPSSQFSIPGAAGIPPFSAQAAPQTPQLRSSTSMMNMMQQGQHGHSMSPPGSAESVAPNSTSVGNDLSNHPFTAGNSDFDNDSEGRKRKLNEFEDLNGKRIRRKTDSEAPVTPSRGSSESVSHPQMAPATLTVVGPVRGQPLRRKIEYIPFAREVDLAGGRDVVQVNELLRSARGRPLREINEWGKVHVDALTMSLRSRISTELSYALTTIVILSTMRGNAPDTGFPLSQGGDLLDEILDLLEELAFEGAGDVDSLAREDTEIVTNRRLVDFARGEIANPFAGTERQQGEHDPTTIGPAQRRGDLIRMILTILRNLSAVTDNQGHMAQHPVLSDLLLRLTCLSFDDGTPRPISPALSLPDLIVLRKDVLNTLVNLAGAIAISSSSSSTAALNKRARRIFELTSSYLVDPVDAVSPVAWILQSGVPVSLHIRAPLLSDAALEVFTRISQPDSNRQVFSGALPKHWIWRLFEALVHRLPTVEHDFSLVMREESWMSYLEKLIMGIYSLAFLMSPELKKRVRADRSLSFAKVMLRLVKKFMGGAAQTELRHMFYYSARRLIEAMKVIDDGDDSFDSTQPSLPPLSFGVGYGEIGDKRIEKGNGIWGGHRNDVLWGIMLHRELDEVMFSELESLARVECEVGSN